MRSLSPSLKLEACHPGILTRTHSHIEVSTYTSYIRTCSISFVPFKKDVNQNPMDTNDTNWIDGMDTVGSPFLRTYVQGNLSNRDIKRYFRFLHIFADIDAMDFSSFQQILNIYNLINFPRPTYIRQAFDLLCTNVRRFFT